MLAIPMRQLILIVLTTLGMVASASIASAQLSDILSGGPLGAQGGGVAAESPESIVTVSSHFTPPANGRQGLLTVTAQIAPPWYTYSTTQKPHGATPTKITVEPSNDFRLLGDFRSTLPPKVVQDAELGVTLEEFSHEVTWQAPVEFRKDVDPAGVTIKGTVRAQVCKVGTCLPPTDYPFEAQRMEAAAAPAAIVEFTHPNTHATLRGYLEPRVATPGSTVNLVLTADMPPGWHIYQLANTDPQKPGNKPTLIAFSNTSAFNRKQTTSNGSAISHPATAGGPPMLPFYEGQVKWTTPIVIPADTKPGSYPIEGLIGYQTCFKDASCDMPRAASFSGTVEVGPAAQTGASALAFNDAKYGEAAKLAASQPAAIDADVEPVQIAGAAPLGWSLPLIMLAGLAGGFILNFMPCVLPVIGLKILSFAEQAGRSRAQILKLNIWYSLGTLMVFMVLATLASSFSLGLGSKNLNWGEQFTYTSFNIVMVGIVFVMALSFLGVWEIPIPGFVGSGKASEFATREGVAGAFSKGVLATILATPCSGPALGPVFGFTLNQPPSITYLLFACIAFGMSAPYLLIGAFPTLIRFLPRPGAWMDTFKNLMGFVLLGTIVFLLSFTDQDYVVPAFAMMVGLWAACWWIGRTPLTENLGRKLVAWAQGGLVAGIVTFLAFTYLVPQVSIIPWQPFSPGELARLRSSGNTVLVDFTADWCLTCKANLKFVIETDEIRSAIRSNNIVPLLADYTKGSSEIKDTLESLESKSIPLLAIFPADRPDQPIVLRDVITKQQLLDAIQQAGPSKGGSQLTASRGIGQ
jgi:suppressor for copper-sensitivity B